MDVKLINKREAQKMLEVGNHSDSLDKIGLKPYAKSGTRYSFYLLSDVLEAKKRIGVAGNSGDGSQLSRIERKLDILLAQLGVAE